MVEKRQLIVALKCDKRTKDEEIHQMKLKIRIWIYRRLLISTYKQLIFSDAVWIAPLARTLLSLLYLPHSDGKTIIHADLLCDYMWMECNPITVSPHFVYSKWKWFRHDTATVSYIMLIFYSISLSGCRFMASIPIGSSLKCFYYLPLCWQSAPCLMLLLLFFYSS